MTTSDIAIENRIIELLQQRALTASICPSDVARALISDEADWRALMPSVRQVAAVLAREGKVVITQGSLTLDPDDISHGPIRVRRGLHFPEMK